VTPDELQSHGKTMPSLLNYPKSLKGGIVRKLRGVADKEAGISEVTQTSQTEAMKEYAETDEDWVEIWEIRDYKRGQILAINLDHNKFLRRPVYDDIQDSIQGVPFEDICFNPDNDVYWGPSDMRILEPIQLELNEIRTQMSKHRKINTLKFLINDKISETEVQKLLAGDVGVALRIPGLVKDDVIVVQVGEPVQLRQDAIEVEKDGRETVGFSRIAEGAESVAPRKTKYEVQEMHTRYC